jgi:hypothetical protein
MSGTQFALCLCACALLCLVSPEPARTASAGPAWDGWRFLLGDWVGEGGGQPGQASAGAFRFAADLDGHVLVRRSYAEYPATEERAAFRHDDWIVVYRDQPGDEVRALYLDSEGHVIHYATAVDTAAGIVAFTSVPDPRAPRYRFTYRRLAPDSLAFRFDVAPPGKPDSLVTYVRGTARRKR